MYSIASWKKELSEKIYGKLHVGDKIIQVNDMNVGSAEGAQMFIKCSAKDEVKYSGVFLVLWHIGYTLKTPGSNGVKRVNWGQTPFRVNDDPAIRQLDVEYDPELGQSDPIIGQVCRKLTKFWAISYTEPQWILFWVTLTRVFLECNRY